MERLDKVLSNLGYGTRKEVKYMVKKSMIEVNDVVVKDSGLAIEPEKCKIKVNGEEVNYRKYIYIMMNKPSGVISATFDNYDKTVIDLLDEEYRIFDPFPVGRLDKDTEGLLLITNDGELNHRLISPKWHVDKKYYAEINKPVSDDDVNAFSQGIVLDDGYKCLPGKLNIIKSAENGSEVEVIIHEGKFHQVKRMFESLGKEVVFLKRMNFGPLELDSALKEGSYRELSQEEVSILKDI
ncbi:16S rRNA pseudouridine(516) synthase [Clostridium sp. JN-9]|uniref:pseudouridine synthase n=1 Tax=Clostridium sp. JN-9 TaxID=2507159 RepID=UPI000FFE0420|nr:16S rRNA pseudouridine(516) synthase [Clostridium sp. JN-9]QAT39324.1 16S rRNA pseudouridine(516) synthase [Clostridium sp. JN-9]